MALDRYIRSSFRARFRSLDSVFSLENICLNDPCNPLPTYSEDIIKSIPTLEPALRHEAKSRAASELESSVSLFRRAREQTNVNQYGSSEEVKSREMLVLSAEAALTNENFDMAREQVRVDDGLEHSLLQYTAGACVLYACGNLSPL